MHCAVCSQQMCTKTAFHGVLVHIVEMPCIKQCWWLRFNNMAMPLDLLSAIDDYLSSQPQWLMVKGRMLSRPNTLSKPWMTKGQKSCLRQQESRSANDPSWPRRLARCPWPHHKVPGAMNTSRVAWPNHDLFTLQVRSCDLANIKQQPSARNTQYKQH